MADNQTMHGQEEEPILSIIQRIKDGSLNPKTLPVETRQQCIGVLLAEGYMESAIAQILGRSDKTISRDLVEIRERNAPTPGLNFAKQIVGDMFQKGMINCKYLMRLARSPEASYADKAQAEFMAWRVLKEVVEKMQTLGYLPLKPQQIVEDVFHHMDETNSERSIAEAKCVLEEIEKVAKESGKFDAETEEKIKAIKMRIEKAEVNDELDKLVKEKNKPKPDQEV